jgi:hypothetical protein
MDRLTKDDVERLRSCFLQNLAFVAREIPAAAENYNVQFLTGMIEAVDKLQVMSAMIDRDPNVFAFGEKKNAA